MIQLKVLTAGHPTLYFFFYKSKPLFNPVFLLLKWPFFYEKLLGNYLFILINLSRRTVRYIGTKMSTMQLSIYLNSYLSIYLAIIVGIWTPNYEKKVN